MWKLKPLDSNQECIQSHVAKSHSAQIEGVWDMAIECLVAQEFNKSCNPVRTSAIAITKVRLVCDLSAPAISIWWCSSSWLKDNSCSVHFSSFKFTLHSRWILNLPVNHILHVTEYCAIIGTHSTVWGNKLLNGHVPDPFPWCGMGFGHAD